MRNVTDVLCTDTRLAVAVRTAVEVFRADESGQELLRLSLPTDKSVAFTASRRLMHGSDAPVQHACTPSQLSAECMLATACMLSLGRSDHKFRASGEFDGTVVTMVCWLVGPHMTDCQCNCEISRHHAHLLQHLCCRADTALHVLFSVAVQWAARRELPLLQMKDGVSCVWAQRVQPAKLLIASALPVAKRTTHLLHLMRRWHSHLAMLDEELE